MLQTVGALLLSLSAIPAIISVILHAQTPWRETAVGRNLMAYAVVLATLITMAIIALWWNPPWFGWLRVVVYFGFFVVLCWRAVLQWRARHLNLEE